MVKKKKSVGIRVPWTNFNSEVLNFPQDPQLQDTWEFSSVGVRSRNWIKIEVIAGSPVFRSCWMCCGLNILIKPLSAWLWWRRFPQQLHLLLIFSHVSSSPPKQAASLLTFLSFYGAFTPKATPLCLQMDPFVLLRSTQPAWERSPVTLFSPEHSVTPPPSLLRAAEQRLHGDCLLRSEDCDSRDGSFKMNEGINK